MVPAELLDRLSAIAAFGNQGHVWLVGDQAMPSRSSA
jgi:hypothetical protein